MSDTPELAIVMPIYNEAANIDAVMTEWLRELSQLRVSFRLFAVNDGSTDATADMLQTLAQSHPGLVVPVQKQNAGHGRACRTGYDLALECASPWTFQIDSDGQCDPQFFSSFWLGRGDVDCIFGVRATRDDGLSRRLLSGICRLLVSLVSGVDLKDLNVPYRLMRTSALKEALSKIPADFDMQNAALTLALKRNRALKWRYVPIHFRGRQGGAGSINLARVVSMGWNLLRNLHKISR